MPTYDPDALPDLKGKVIIVTGSSAGIGLDAARVLVKKCGAHVILACRNLAKAKLFEEELNAAGNGKATLLRIDTSDLSSVRAFADEFLAINLGRLDCLCLNAGIMFGEYRTVPTASSEHPNCELQFATNNLGHFLLTQLLLPVLMATPGAKIVSTSSVAAAVSFAIDYDVLKCAKPESYQQVLVYSFTKLGNLLFTRELSKRLKAAGADTIAVACHPGYARTELQTKESPNWMQMLLPVLSVLSQSSSDGAQCILLATTDPSPEDGVYYAPSGFMQLAGVATSTAGVTPLKAKSEEEALKFWNFCEELSGAESLI